MTTTSKLIDGAVEVVFSFDTTGSMYPALSQVRRNIRATATRLMKEIPGIRIGIIAHGDYCDKGSTYVTKILDITDDADRITRFVDKVEPTGGGDAPECYELVLNEAKDMSWTPNYTKCLVMIGDDVPHGPAHNPRRLDWRVELAGLITKGIQVYGVQALGRSHATAFYKELAEKSGGFHLNLDQFSAVTDMILAICYKQTGDAKLEDLERELGGAGRMNRSMNDVFTTLLKRSKSVRHYATPGLAAVPPSRFQVLAVDKDASIMDFVQDNGLRFHTGRGFYEFTKTETIQAKKEVVLVERKTGDMYTGVAARALLGLPEGVNARIKPTSLADYMVFVQSTSSNRRLKGGTRFLYEVAD